MAIQAPGLQSSIPEKSITFLIAFVKSPLKNAKTRLEHPVISLEESKKEEQFCGELGLLPESIQDATQACFGE